MLQLIQEYWVIAWLICGVIGYLLVRNDIRKHGKWTKGDRLMGFLFTLAGPVFMIGVLVVKLYRVFGNDEPANW